MKTLGRMSFEDWQVQQDKGIEVPFAREFIRAYESVVVAQTEFGDYEVRVAAVGQSASGYSLRAAHAGDPVLVVLYAREVRVRIEEDHNSLRRHLQFGLSRESAEIMVVNAVARGRNESVVYPPLGKQQLRTIPLAALTSEHRLPLAGEGLSASDIVVFEQDVEGTLLARTARGFNRQIRGLVLEAADEFQPVKVAAYANPLSDPNSVLVWIVDDADAPPS